MQRVSYDSAIFINCPFDKSYESLLEAAIFCCVYLGFHPQLATISLEAGENRFNKIVELIKQSKYSIHDLSRCKAVRKGDSFRMNMPFEFGLDFGLRLSGNTKYRQKKFLVFEKNRFDLKSSLSDIAGQDAECHEDSFELIVQKTRHFLRVEAKIDAPGPKQIIADYAAFQAWYFQKKIGEGHSEEEAINLPTLERIEEMQVWLAMGKPDPVVT